jgi:hypothetical protein
LPRLRQVAKASPSCQGRDGTNPSSDPGQSLVFPGVLAFWRFIARSRCKPRMMRIPNAIARAQ